MTDTHTHLTDKQFSEDISLLIENSFANGIDIIINNTVTESDGLNSIKIAEKYSNFYSTFGIHPLDAYPITEVVFNNIIRYIQHPKVVAIGEIGLDYHYCTETKVLQKEIFGKQLEIAEKYNMPVVIHARDAVHDTIDIIRSYNISGVFHCFAGSLNELKDILNLGFYIGFDGPITFKNNHLYKVLLENCPLDRILCETDSPYLSPVPYRGKRNEPLNVRYVYEKIADIKNIEIDVLIDIVHKNTLNLFTKIQKNTVNIC